MANRNQGYFYRAGILDHATYTVGLPSLPKNKDELWDVVAKFNEKHPRLELPDPFNLLDFAKHIGLVSFKEFQRLQRVSGVWDVIDGACISIGDVRQGTSLPTRTHQGKLHQQFVLDFSPPPTPTMEDLAAIIEPPLIVERVPFEVVEHLAVHELV